MFTVQGALAGKEGGSTEEVPEVTEGEFAMFGRLSESFFQIDFVVVGGAAVGFGRV